MIGRVIEIASEARQLARHRGLMTVSAGGNEGGRGGANRFRNFLLDEGFDRCQYSVYLRFCSGKDQAQTYTRRVQQALPPDGDVQIIYFTDKQYENIVSFSGARRAPANRNPAQYTLF